METRKITLEELYDFMKMKFGNIEYHLALHDKQFEQINDRFEQIEKHMVNLEEKVQAVYETRDKVTMQFNRRVLLGNSVLAGIVAFFVALVTGRYTTS